VSVSVCKSHAHKLTEMSMQVMQKNMQEIHVSTLHLVCWIMQTCKKRK